MLLGDLELDRGPVRQVPQLLGESSLTWGDLVGYDATMSTKKAKISVTIDEKLYAKIQQVAEARGDAVSQVIERILLNEIDSEMRFIGLMENPITAAVVKRIAQSSTFMATVAKAVGQEMTAADLKFMHDESERQAVRGRERRAKKKAAKGATGETA